MEYQGSKPAQPTSEVVTTTHGEDAPHDLDRAASWLSAFAADHGRPLRVLHVGNIANNAYLNAKFLRSIGVDAHVLCYDYDHVMATPEWEEIEISQSHHSDFWPVFSYKDRRNYTRPKWFISGPLDLCLFRIDYLNEESEKLPLIYKFKSFCANNIEYIGKNIFGLRICRIMQRSIFAPTQYLWKIFPPFFFRLILICAHLVKDIFFKAISRIVRLIVQLMSYLLTIFNIDTSKMKFYVKTLIGILFGFSSVAQFVVRERWANRDHESVDAPQIIRMFDAVFPHRRDRLTKLDVVMCSGGHEIFRNIFRHYDIVQCYATDPIWALVCEKRPFVAFEHGTLRDFTTGDDPKHRMNALAYRAADHTFVTNGDCLAYAQRLGIESFSPITHPLDVDQHRRNFGTAISGLRSEIGGDVILFCPVRHDWQVKGTDVHLRALPLIKARVNARIKIVLIRWGSQIEESESLLQNLGCAEDAIWKPSMCRIAMIKHIQAADIVLDQMALPHFGATAPQAMAAGTPVVSSYVPESTLWIIPEPAPIIPAFTPEDVADAVVTALDRDWLETYKTRARRWIDTYHHPNNVIRDHIAVYQSVLQNT